MWYLVFSNMFDDTFIEANTRTKMGAPLLPASYISSITIDPNNEGHFGTFT